MNESFEKQSDDDQSRQVSTVVVGAVRGAGKIRGANGQTATARATTSQAAPEDAERLWHALSILKTFLLQGKRSGNEFAQESHASRYFSTLRKACDQSSMPIIATLEEFCTQRREFDIQQRLHLWLHSWLPIHIGLSVAVTVLLVVHVITAIRYW